MMKAPTTVLNAQLLEFDEIFVGVLKISLRIPMNMSSNFSNYAFNTVFIAFNIALLIKLFTVLHK